MNTETKQLIADRANEWIKDHSSSGNKLAEKAGVSNAYASKILKGVFKFENGRKEASPISEQIFYKMANTIGLNLEFVPHFESGSFERITTACLFAQVNHRRVLIDSKDSGLSKTYSLEHYAKSNTNVLYVKCTSLMKGKDLIQLLMDKLHIHVQGRVSNSEKLQLITDKLLKPGYLIILDEFENVSPDMYRVIKDIEDATYQKCGLVLCGMGIINELQTASKRQKKLGPQLWRRFRTNKLQLGYYRKDYTMDACAEHNITNGKVVKWLSDRVTDYGMLSEYIKDIHTHIIRQGEEVSLERIEGLFKPL